MTHSLAITKSQFSRLASNGLVLLHPRLSWRRTKDEQIYAETRRYDSFIIDEFSFLEGQIAFGQFIGVVTNGGMDQLGLIFPSACYDILTKKLRLRLEQ